MSLVDKTIAYANFKVAIRDLDISQFKDKDTKEDKNSYYADLVGIGRTWCPEDVALNLIECYNKGVVPTYDLTVRTNQSGSMAYYLSLPNKSSK